MDGRSDQQIKHKKSIRIIVIQREETHPQSKSKENKRKSKEKKNQRNATKQRSVQLSNGRITSQVLGDAAGYAGWKLEVGSCEIPNNAH